MENISPEVQLSDYKYFLFPCERSECDILRCISLAQLRGFYSRRKETLTSTLRLMANNESISALVIDMALESIAQAQANYLGWSGGGNLILFSLFRRLIS